MNPLVRSGLIARSTGDEVVVYDPATHTAHCLNRSAALVFAAADGRSSVAELAGRVGRESAGMTEDLVWEALARLSEAKLLAGPLPSRAPSGSRRRAVGRVVLGAALTPLVLSLVVPTPAEAAATCIPATSCSASNFGQPCYNVSTVECASKTCTGVAGDCQ